MKEYDFIGRKVKQFIVLQRVNRLNRVHGFHWLSPCQERGVFLLSEEDGVIQGLYTGGGVWEMA